MQATIERASLKHLDTLYEIEKECFQREAFNKEQMAYAITASNSIFLVSKVRCKIVGFIMAEIYVDDKTKRGHIITIDVLTEYRRKRIGLRLLKKVEESFKDESVKECRLEVRKNNIAALNLYRKTGYKTVRMLKNYYENANGILLEKILT
jgi:ribosomal-protein-alanine N-acetyltransferase